MFEAMLQHYKELLQGGMICIQAAAQAQGRLEQDLDAEFHHVHQVDTLLHHLALGSCGAEAGDSFVSALNAVPGEEARRRTTKGRPVGWSALSTHVRINWSSQPTGP